MGRDKLTFFLGPSAILRIFALGGGSLRLISQDSLVDFKVQLKMWLFVIMFALGGFLILILLAQKFFFTKKNGLTKVINFCWSAFHILSVGLSLWIAFLPNRSVEHLHSGVETRVSIDQKIINLERK